VFYWKCPLSECRVVKTYKLLITIVDSLILKGDISAPFLTIYYQLQKSRSPLWRDDSNSLMSAEPNIFDFGNSPLLRFTQKRQLLAKCAVLREVGLSL
jgi:hypothetical protein